MAPIRPAPYEVRDYESPGTSPAESFFATLKKELVAGEVFYSRRQACRELVDYIEGFYNCWRRHSSLGYLSPVAFEEQLA